MERDGQLLEWRPPRWSPCWGVIARGGTDELRAPRRESLAMPVSRQSWDRAFDIRDVATFVSLWNQSCNGGQLYQLLAKGMGGMG